MFKERSGGQVFYGDAFIGFAIFAVAVVAFFSLSSNSSFSERPVLDSLISNAESVSDSLITEGFPPDWTPDMVNIVGLTDGSYRVNYTKVSMLYNMSYNSTNNLFGANANYLIFFKDRDGNTLAFDRCAFTNTDLILQNLTPYICENVTAPNSTQLVNSERLLFYNSNIVKLVVYAWV